MLAPDDTNLPRVRRIKVLLSSFACRPNSGSEAGVGWRWAVELAKLHHVVVLTDETRRREIEREMVSRCIPHLEFEFYRPHWLRAIPLNSATAQLLYSAWQYSVLPFARRLHKKHRFDLVIHLTYGVYRHPSFLGFIGAPFVFGPVGGGEDAPWRLKASLPPSERAKEVARTILNRAACFNPFLRIALSRAALILAKTAHTARALPVRNRDNVLVHSEIGVDADDVSYTPGRRRDSRSPLAALFVGRLLGWKGIHLAIRAIAEVRTRQCDVTLTIVGTGPLEGALKTLSRELGIAGHIKWVGQLPQRELLKAYQHFDCFVFPSLHDSSGNVVLEAMASGLPVVCLDLGGPATLVANDCAKVVSTDGCREPDVVESLAEALRELATDEVQRRAMSAAARRRALETSWEQRVRSALQLIEARTGMTGLAPASLVGSGELGRMP